MNTTATPTNSTVNTTTDSTGQKINTVTLNTPPVTAAPVMTIADRLKAKLNKGKTTADKTSNPITPKVMFEQLDTPGTVTSFIEAALNGEDKQPLVILASHVNRSECLKAAHAAIKFADLAAKYAPTYGLTAPEFTRLLAKLIIQDYNPATLEAEQEAAAPAATVEATQTQTLTNEQTAAQTTATSPETIPPAPAETPGETANIFGITDAPAPANTAKKGRAKA